MKYYNGEIVLCPECGGRGTKLQQDYTQGTPFNPQYKDMLCYLCKGGRVLKVKLVPLDNIDYVNEKILEESVRGDD